MGDVKTYHLSPAQIRVLRNLAQDRAASDGISGRSAYGGLSGTIVSLSIRGLIGREGKITDAGRAALKAAGVEL